MKSRVGRFQKNNSKNDPAASQHGTGRTKGATKSSIPRFLTKKEKEAKELLDKKQKAFREKQKRMKELEKEIEEMQQLVFIQIKDPAIKRRHTLTSFREMLPPAD